jgi:hypothetical protein
MADREARRVAVERARLLAPLLVPARHVLQDLLQLRLELLQQPMQAVALGLRQSVEGVGLQYLALLGQRRHAEAERRAHDGDLVLAGLLGQRREGLLLLAAEGLVDRAPTRLVVLALERGGQRRAEIADQFGDGGAELRAAPRRQAQRARLVRLGEVVDVDPVVRRRLAVRLLLQQGAHRAVDTGTRGADHEQVEPGRLHARAETQRIERACLPDRLVVRRCLGGGSKRQRCRVDAARQLVDVQGGDGHRFSAVRSH